MVIGLPIIIAVHRRIKGLCRSVDDLIELIT